MINSRKEEHIRICLEEKVEGGDTLLSQVRLPHKAAPEIDKQDIELGITLFGKRLEAPMIIAAMTGGCRQAEKINANLAKAAQSLGIGMQLGSQRAGLEGKEAGSYRTARENAPDALLIGNIGAVQLANGYGNKEAKAAVEMIKADALAIHFNPLQEAIQPEGETRFKGALEKVRALDAGVPLVAKETGCGIMKETAQMLKKSGFSAVDTAGAGGTNFGLVESYRGNRRGLAFKDWGIPTAQSILECRGTGLPIIASGGIRGGIDAAKAIALGAEAVGIALPLLKCANKSEKAVEEKLKETIEELRTAMFLVGAKNTDELKKTPCVLGHELRNIALQRGLI